jgi:hypothetical protein
MIMITMMLLLLQPLKNAAAGENDETSSSC